VCSSDLAEADPALALATAVNGINTALILGGIAAGIIAPKLLFLRRVPVV